jgi:hypothetical protein
MHEHHFVKRGKTLGDGVASQRIMDVALVALARIGAASEGALRCLQGGGQWSVVD